MKRKMLALFLIAVMTMSFITVRAENIETYTDFSPFLSSIGIELPADEVDLEDMQRPITKAEFVYLVVSAMGKNAKLDKEYLTFSDVKLDSWYHDKVITAASEELIYGHENGYFGVDDEVTEDVGALIILRALGFGMLPSDREDKSNLIAANSSVYTKLLKDIKRDGVISVADAYCMIYNMLGSNYVVRSFSAKESYYVETSKTYMQVAFDLKMQSGKITGNEYTSLSLGGLGVGHNRVEIDGVIYETQSDDVIKYLGYGVDFCVDEDDNRVLYIIPKQENNVTNISSTDIISCQVSGNNVTFSYEDENGNETRFNISSGFDFVYNGETEGFTKARIDDLRDNKIGEITIVEYRGSFLVDVMAYNTMIVDTVSTYDKVIYGKYGAGSVSIDEYDSGYLIVEKDGEACSQYEIKKDDVIQFAVSGSKNNRKIVVCDYVLTGAVTNGVIDKEIKIDDVTYPVSNYLMNRLSLIDLKIGVKQKFLFNANGELVDIVENSADYSGEYVFIVEARKIRKEDTVRIKYVTMDAAMITAYLAEKVRYNGIKSLADDVLNSGLLSGGIAIKQLVYIKKNADGNISAINTVDQKDVNGTIHKDDIIKLEAAERKRKCKQQTAWLVGVDDKEFPEFYTDSETKMLMVPESSASDETFKDEANYEVKSVSSFKDAEDYTVEAYNFDDYNVAGIMLLKQEKTFDSRHSNNSLILVTSVGQMVDEFGDIIPYIKGYQNGTPVEFKLKDDSVLTYTNKNAQIKKYDILRFNVDNNDFAIHAEYIKNVNTDFAITDTPVGTDEAVGRNDGNAIFIGTVVSHKDNYLKLRFTPAATTMERVFRGNVSNLTIFDDGTCCTGTVEDMTPGSKVLIRVYYTTLRDVIVIK